MTALMLQADPAADSIQITDSRILVHLTDGRDLSVPLECYPRLRRAVSEEQEKW